MPTLHLLGTGAALSDPHRTTTMLAVQSASSVIVVDCGGDVIQRLMAAGVPLADIEALIVTHEHPDHVGGFPLFMEKLWLASRRHPIPVYGPASAIDHARRLFACFNTSGWEGMPEIEWHEVALAEQTEVLQSEQWRVSASPGDHSGVPVIALRVEARQGGGIVAYSADTAPSDAVARLAQGATILVHEATGDFGGHSSAEGAARIARQAGADRLLLVHIPPADHLPEAQMDSARAIFEQVERGEELGHYEF